jgi:hypothetical protein
MREKLAFREKPFTGIQAAVAARESRLRALWETRLAEQVAQLPEFNEAFRSVRRTPPASGYPSGNRVCSLPTSSFRTDQNGTHLDIVLSW